MSQDHDYNQALALLTQRCAYTCYLLGRLRGDLALLPRSSRSQLAAVLSELLGAIEHVDSGSTRGERSAPGGLDRPSGSGASPDPAPSTRGGAPPRVWCELCWSEWLPHELFDGEACPKCKLVL